MLQVVTDISGYRNNWAYLDWARNLINKLISLLRSQRYCFAYGSYKVFKINMYWVLRYFFWPPLSLERVECNEMFGPLILFFVKKKALASKKLTAFKFTDKMRYATDGYIPSPKTEKSSMLRNNRMCLFSC